LKTFKRNITLFLLLFTVVSLNGAEFFHHHENESIKGDDSNCQACLFHSILSTIDVSDISITLDIVSSYRTLILPNYSIPDSEVKEFSSDRAPPQNTI